MTDTLPFDPPLQLTGFEPVELMSGVGSVTTVVLVLVHPFASVTVMVYEPAESPVAAEELPPEGLQLMERGAVPFEIAAVTLPSPPPLHETFVDVEAVAIGPGLAITVAVEVAVHPLASVAVTVKLPLAIPERVVPMLLPGLQV